MLFRAQKWFIRHFLKISILFDFVMKLILKSQRNLPENTNKEAIQRTAIPMKNSSKILNSRNVQKNLIFSYVLCPFRGGDEIRILSMIFCDEIIPPKTVTFFQNLNDDLQEQPALKQISLYQRPSTWGAARPGGSSIPRREQHMQGSSIPRELHSRGTSIQ